MFYTFVIVVTPYIAVQSWYRLKQGNRGLFYYLIFLSEILSKIF